jgi:hypothetical protein
MSFIKSTINKIFQSLGYKVVKYRNEKVIYTKASKLLETDYGHYTSKILKKSVNLQKEPIPWFTYPAIDFLKQLDFRGKTMLEWGSGNSSLFFSERVKQLYSIEHDETWFNQVKDYNIFNQTLVYAHSDYSIKPNQFSKNFDIILIDGIEREQCSKVAVNMLNKGGMIILDNSDRNPNIAEYFRNLGHIEFDFHGFGPINDYTWTTSIFVDRDYCFKPLTIQPTIPIGGGY